MHLALVQSFCITLSHLFPQQSYKAGNIIIPLMQRKPAEVQSGYNMRGETAALCLL